MFCVVYVSLNISLFLLLFFACPKTAAAVQRIKSLLQDKPDVVSVEHVAGIVAANSLNIFYLTARPQGWCASARMQRTLLHTGLCQHKG